MRALIRELIETLILALLIFLVLQFSIQNYRVEGSSMNPTLRQEQHLLANKLVYLRLDPEDLTSLVPFVDVEIDESLFLFHGPKRGEVIIFRFPQNPTRDFVKRVIGVPGDVVEIRQGQVFVNGEGLDEPYITHPKPAEIKGPFHMPPNSYFVLGDNRRASDDSRAWKPECRFVPASNIIGKAWLSYWPRDRWSVIQSVDFPAAERESRGDDSKAAATAPCKPQRG